MSIPWSPLNWALMNILGWGRFKLFFVWVLFVLQDSPLLPTQWAISPFLALSYPNELKNKANLETLEALTRDWFISLLRLTWPPYQAQGESLTLIFCEQAEQSWCTANDNATGCVENRISGRYQDCQIPWIKKAHLIPAFSGEEREENVPCTAVSCSEEDVRKLHGRSLPLQQPPLWPSPLSF